MRTNWKKWGTHPVLLFCVFVIMIVSMVGFSMQPRTLTVMVDGRQQTVRTSAQSTAGIMYDAHVVLNEYDKVDLNTEKLVDGSVLTVRRAVPISIREGAEVKATMSAGKTAAQAITEAGYDPAEYVTLIPADTPVKAGMEIPVGKYTASEITVEEEVPFKIIREPNDRMFAGAEKVTQAGVNGKQKTKYRVLAVDGREVGRVPLESQPLQSAVDQVVQVGTRDIVNTSRGDIRFTKMINMEATAYHPMDGDGRGITASGMKARYGVVAVDPNVIPMGTRVFVPGYGEAIAADTGDAIIGNRIDLCMETYDECYQYGRRNVEVYVLD